MIVKFTDKNNGHWASDFDTLYFCKEEGKNFTLYYVKNSSGLDIEVSNKVYKKMLKLKKKRFKPSHYLIDVR